MQSASLPGGLHTLAAAEPGSELYLRSVVAPGARGRCQRLGLRVGARLRYRAAAAEGPIVATADGRSLMLQWWLARTIQVELVAPGDGLVGRGPRGSAS
jgi:Fe2+ transport system protein FeoA